LITSGKIQSVVRQFDLLVDLARDVASEGFKAVTDLISTAETVMVFFIP
jgi:hypothetical protein